MKKNLATVILGSNLFLAGLLQASVCSSGPTCRVYCPRDAYCSAFFDQQTKICCIDCGEMPSNEYYACLDKINAAKKGPKLALSFLSDIDDSEPAKTCIKE